MHPATMTVSDLVTVTVISDIVGYNIAAPEIETLESTVGGYAMQNLFLQYENQVSSSIIKNRFFFYFFKT